MSFFQKIEGGGHRMLEKIHWGRWFHRVGLRQDKLALIAVEKLIERSRFEWSFLEMCALSGLIATLGILLNDIAILISAMVLAPLLNPLLALSAGIALSHPRLIFYAFKTILGSIIVVVGLSSFVVAIFVRKGYGFDLSEMSVRFLDLHPLFFFTAFVSGFSAVYAWLRAHEASNLIGVMIAVSLIPFVSFFGVLVGFQAWEKALIFLPTLLFDLLCIIMGALLAFVLLGFSRQRSRVGKRIDKDIKAEG